FCAPITRREALPPSGAGPRGNSRAPGGRPDSTVDAQQALPGVRVPPGVSCPGSQGRRPEPATWHERTGDQQTEQQGIFTVRQLSYTFRVRRSSKRAKKRAFPHSLPLQALAIRENKVHVYGNYAVPSSSTS